MMTVCLIIFNQLISPLLLIFGIAVTIGLQETSYEVGESAPSVRVCAELTAGEAAVSIEVNLMTDQSGNADGMNINFISRPLIMIISN